MNVVNYYTNVYNEENRLGNNCDNRHKVERIVKTQLLANIIRKNKVKKICELGAGTGLYSLYFAKKGYKVSACDLVPRHVEIIKKKSDLNKLNVETYVCNANNTPFKTEEFDIVLVSGPIYHTNSLNNKIKIINEARRIVKDNGIIVVDYLSDIHGYIQHVLLDNNFLDKNIDLEDMDDIFSYDNKDKMKDLAKITNLELLDIYGVDSITRFIKNDINKLSEEHLNKWIDFITYISNNKNIIDLSEHCLAIFKKQEI